MDITVLWNEVFIRPILNLLVFFYKGFDGLGIEGSLGFAIIALTLLVKILLYPTMVAQTKSMRAMARLKPHMDRIKEQHKKDVMRQQQEIAKLYKEQKINPAAGCLPLLIQFPIIIALYNSLIGLFKHADPAAYINTLVYSPSLHVNTWDTHFFFVNLSEVPAHWQQVGLWLLLVPFITGGLQFVQTRLMPNAFGQPTAQKKAVVVKKKEGTTDTMGDFQNIMQKQMLYFFPVMLAFISYGFPVGLSLYWNTFTVFGIIQQYFLNKQAKKEEEDK